MSSSTPKPSHLKQLREHLQEKQEPFTLDIYLSERYAKKTNSNSDAQHGCLRDNSTKSSNRMRNFDSKRRTGLPNSSKVLKLVTNKLISYKTCSKLSSCECKDQRREKVSMATTKQQVIAMENRFYSHSDNTAEGHLPLKLSHRSPKRSSFQALKFLRLRKLKFQQPDTTKCQRGCTEDIKQLIPVSAEASSVHKNKKYVLITTEEESKRVLRQTKQLLYECTNGAIDTNVKQETRRKSNRETVGPKECKKIMCEQICLWGKQSGHVKNIAQLINLDFSNEMEQWNNFQLLNSDIKIEIGDAILDDIVSEVI